MTMIEKVALAICRAQQPHCHEVHPCDTYPVCKCSWPRTFDDAARAALECLREPTPEMIAGLKHPVDRNDPSEAIETYRQLIDGALNEKAR